MPSKTCKQPIPYALMQPRTISSTMLITHWKVSLLFSLEDKTGCLMSHLTIEHFSTLKQSIWNKPWPTGHDGTSGPCLHMASFLHDRALVGICRWQGRLCLPTVVSGSIFYTSNKGLQTCPLRTEIYPVSMKVLMMLCTVDDEICKAFAIWRWGTLFLKYSIIFLHTHSQIGEPLPIFTSERLPL